MHLLPLGAFRPDAVARVISALQSLNAPSGAQRFPTRRSRRADCGPLRPVSMHLLVLSAFRPRNLGFAEVPFWGLNAPSGAQCFPTSPRRNCPGRSLWRVSMHLLVLSAFRRRGFVPGDQAWLRLNAPSGAQCFPTREIEASWAMVTPSQCTFWCSVLSDFREDRRGVKWMIVSMHLLVLSAFRPIMPSTNKTPQLQVSMHLLVLSAFRLRPQKTAPQRRLPERNRRRPGKHHIESARTCPIKPHNREKPPQNDPPPPTPPTSQYATDFQRTQAKKPTPHDYAAVDTATKATDDCPLHRHDGLLPADLPVPLTAATQPSAVFMSTVGRPWRSHGGPGRT